MNRRQFLLGAGAVGAVALLPSGTVPDSLATAIPEYDLKIQVTTITAKPRKLNVQWRCAGPERIYCMNNYGNTVDTFIREQQTDGTWITLPWDGNFSREFA